MAKVGDLLVPIFRYHLNSAAWLFIKDPTGLSRKVKTDVDQ